MKVLNPAMHSPKTIDLVGTMRFEAFLDRNFPDWRGREFNRPKNAGTLQRCWMIAGNDDIERVAVFRGEYVEIIDRYSDYHLCDNGMEYLLKHAICHINGDRSPVAKWGSRSKPGW